MHSANKKAKQKIGNKKKSKDLLNRPTRNKDYLVELLQSETFTTKPITDHNRAFGILDCTKCDPTAKTSLPF